MLHDQNLIAAIERLRSEGFKTGLLTNVGFKGGESVNQIMTINLDNEFQQTVTTAPSYILSHFDINVESCRVGLRKPNPKIYEVTAHRLGLQASECVYIDELARNCRGAEIADMKSIQVRINE